MIRKYKSKIIYPAAFLANFMLIIFTAFIFTASYGSDRFFVLLLVIPPLLSTAALRNNGDKEERNLKKRIKKAQLRKELKELHEFDISDNA